MVASRNALTTTNNRPCESDTITGATYTGQARTGITMNLLTRDEFRRGVFARDNFICVVCGDDAQDAHHIMERRLWPDGGYYLSNGASVCGDCHLLCEQTQISPQELWSRIGIKGPVLPPHLYPDQVYDKWGNPVLPSGGRLRGELFWDESVQKVLAPVLCTFTDRVKYPRTYHLPWSNGTDDDRFHDRNRMGHFWGENVVVTLKYDGENTTLYRDGLHARSVDSQSKPWQSWVRNYHSQIAHEIPEGWRICGENVFAMHSIHYNALSSYFLGFSVWTDRNECLSWDDTLEWFYLLGISPVATLIQGPCRESDLRALSDCLDPNVHEGYVVRPRRAFQYSEFRNVVGKYVRPNHVQTSHHWQRQQIVQNKLTTGYPKV